MPLISVKAGHFKQCGGLKDDTMTAIFKHKESGSVDTRDGWIGSYVAFELEERGLTAEQAFTQDLGKTLFELEEGSREWAVAFIGETNVDAVERENCEPSCRVGGNGLMRNDPYLEYTAAIEIDTDAVPLITKDLLPVTGCSLTAYYRASNELEQKAIDAEADIFDFYDLPIDEYRID